MPTGIGICHKMRATTLPDQSKDHADMVAQAGTAISGVPEEAQRKYSAQSRIALLSRRELVVLDKVAAGKTNKIIAQELGLSVRTIENHRANILRKVGAQNSPELVRIAMEARIHPENE